LLSDLKQTINLGIAIRLDITRLNTVTGDAIWSLANSGLDFLDSRTEFWRQQKPIYARKNSFADGADTSSNNPLNYVIKRLETIDTCNWNDKFYLN